MKQYHKAKITDAPFIASLYQNPKNNKYLVNRDLDISTLQRKMKNRFRHDYVIDGIGWFAVMFCGNVARIALIIDKPHQGQGYGRKAMRWAEIEARKFGAKKMELEVFKNNMPARRLYEKVGYKTKATLQLMEKNIR